MATDSVSDLLKILGELIKRARAKRMSQAEFSLRVGCSEKTISRMELGQAVNSETLFQALEMLDLLDDYILTAERQLRLQASSPTRHRTDSATEEDFPNDF